MLKRLKMKVTAAATRIWAARRMGVTGVAFWLGWIDPDTAKGICVGVYTAWIGSR